MEFTPGTCVNCGSPRVTEKSPLYCGEQCRQAAELVRYVRACRRDGRDRRPDIQEAIKMRLAMVLGGGYPERSRRVSDVVRAEVFQRACGKCENCGRKLDLDGTTGDPDALATIQHVHGDSNDHSNLKAFCRRCNMADAQTRFVPVLPGSPEEQLAEDLRTRWMSPEPMRVCDDEQHWSGVWRELAREAKEVIRLRMEMEEAAGDEDLPGFQGWTDQGTPIQDI